MTIGSSEARGVRWRKLAVDGFVIVASILLAFAIDAWWDTFRDRAAAERQLDVLNGQIAANYEVLEQAAEQLSVSEAAMGALIHVIGPRRGSVQTTYVGALRT